MPPQSPNPSYAPGMAGNKAGVTRLCVTTLQFSPSSVVTIGFDPATYSITEGAGSVDVTVAVQGPLGRDVVVTLSTVDGTATGGCNITC